MTVVQIPARDYNIDCSELEITCHYLNSSVPGGNCSAYKKVNDCKVNDSKGDLPFGPPPFI